MSIFQNWFKKTPPKLHTVHLAFRLPNGGVRKVTHPNVKLSQVWFRVLADTPDQEPMCAIHMFTLGDDTVIMYRDDGDHKLMEFKTE